MTEQQNLGIQTVARDRLIEPLKAEQPEIATNDEYRDVARQLLRVECLDQTPLLLPRTIGDPPRVNIGDLTDEQDQELCCIVCQRTTGMTAPHWATLDESQRINWMRQASQVGWEPTKDGPPKELLVELSRQEREIVKYLWDRGTATVDQLESHLTDNARQPDALRQAISRLKKRLRKFREIHIEVHLKSPNVHLVRNNSSRQ